MDYCIMVTDKVMLEIILHVTVSSTKQYKGVCTHTSYTMSPADWNVTSPICGWVQLTYGNSVVARVTGNITRQFHFVAIKMSLEKCAFLYKLKIERLEVNFV